jgi:hypothetical protein
MKTPTPLQANRIRVIEKPFAWIPFRILTDGIFANLSDEGKLLYLFLCLAADRTGISFYGDRRILSYFQQLDSTNINLARKELIQKDLIAHDGRVYQVLSLPKTKDQNPHVHKQKTSEPERFADILTRLANTTR